MKAPAVLSAALCKVLNGLTATASEYNNRPIHKDETVFIRLGYDPTEANMTSSRFEEQDLSTCRAYSDVQRCGNVFR